MVALTSNSIKNTKMIPATFQWPDASSTKQFFSLPSSTIYYISKNPTTAKFYSKLIQSCKYFFEKMPVLVAADIYGDTYICSDENCTGKGPCCAKLNLDTNFSKIWFTSSLYRYYSLNRNFISLLCSKIFRCEFVYIFLLEEDIKFEHFLLLVSSAKIVRLADVKITYKDGSLVMLENIIEAIPNIETFDYKDIEHSVSTSTVKTIAKVCKNLILKKFFLKEMPEIFNINDYAALIKDHRDTKFFLTFKKNISDQYRICLDKFIDTIIKSEIPNRLIKYNGQDLVKLNIMNDRFSE